MPFLGKWKFGHRFNLGFLGAILFGAILLTWQAVQEDSRKPEYVASVRQASLDAKRVKALARERGIPAAGAIELLRTDPLTQGPKLFARNCASCHRYDGHDGLGGKPADLQSASDLKGFASRAWLTGLLEPAKVDSTNYFGATTHREGKMVDFVKKKVTAYDAEKREQLRKALIAVSAEAGLKSQAAVEAGEVALIAEGRKLMRDTMSCIDCHQYREPDDHATAPDLTGYGSREWLTTFIRNPEHIRFYSETNDRMPAFGDSGRLDEKSIGLIADWLRGEWYEPPTISSRD